MKSENGIITTNQKTITTSKIPTSPGYQYQATCKCKSHNNKQETCVSISIVSQYQAQKHGNKAYIYIMSSHAITSIHVVYINSY